MIWFLLILLLIGAVYESKSLNHTDVERKTYE